MIEKDSLKVVYCYDLQLFAKDGPNGEKTEDLYIKNDSAVKPESNLQLIQALAAMAEDRGADF